MKEEKLKRIEGAVWPEPDAEIEKLILELCEESRMQTKELSRLSLILGRVMAICSAFNGDEIKDLPNWIDGSLVELMEAREAIKNNIAHGVSQSAQHQQHERIRGEGVWKEQDAQIRFFVTLGECEEYRITRQEFLDLAHTPEKLRFDSIYRKLSFTFSEHGARKDQQLKMLGDTVAMLMNAINQDAPLTARVKALSEEIESLKDLAEMRGRERDAALKKSQRAFDNETEAVNKLDFWRAACGDLERDMRQVLERHKLTAVPDKTHPASDEATGWRHAWPDKAGWWWSFWPGRKAPELSLWDKSMIAYYKVRPIENLRVFQPVGVPQPPEMPR